MSFASSKGNWPLVSRRVACIKELRPRTHIEDPDIPTLLLRAKQPTLVTINYRDFWLKTAAHREYSVICMFLGNDEWPEVDPVLGKF